MNPLIALIIGEIAKNAPLLVIDIIQALHKGGTDQDFAELRAKWSAPASQFYKDAAATLPIPGTPLTT